MTNLFVRSGISFVDRSEVLTHIGNEMLAKGVVYDTWPQALIAREAEFPTGIMLEQHAIAIPHCEAIHAKSSAIYLLRRQQIKFIFSKRMMITTWRCRWLLR